MYRKWFSGFIGITMALILIFIFSGNSFAQAEKKRGPHVEGGATGIDFITLFDSDKDGKISHDEWEKVKPSTVYRKKRWPEYDINRDRYITLEEVPQHGDASEPAPPPDIRFTVNAKQIAFIAKFDQDKDGKVNNKEFTDPEFTTFDKNGDGYIEAYEAPDK